jgi:hypothetical protein
MPAAGHHEIDYAARLGSVKALASLDPRRGLAALTEPSVSPALGNYVMAGVLLTDANDRKGEDQCEQRRSHRASR